MDVNDKIHAQLVKAGVRLAASLPDDWVNTLIRRISQDNQIRHVPVGREAETIAICAGAFFGGVRSVAIFGNTGLLTCTGEMATLCLRHAIPVFCIVSGRGSIDDHKVYQEVQGRRTIPLLQAYDYPYKVIDKPDEIVPVMKKAFNTQGPVIVGVHVDYRDNHKLFEMLHEDSVH